jgi:hypothetical protein
MKTKPYLQILLILGIIIPDSHYMIYDSGDYTGVDSRAKEQGGT